MGRAGEQEVGKCGATALEIEKDKWKHAETENFILHYRRATEAQKVAREVEYDLWFVAKVLGAGRDRYQRKSHVFVFEDEDEWKKFVGLTKAPPWAASFAHGDELFLNVRRTEGPKRFDSNTLAHEATHAVVARLFPQKRWPLWLNEGWAEYMGGASVAARKGQSVKGHQSRLRLAGMPLATLEALREYPSDEAAVGQLLSDIGKAGAIPDGWTAAGSNFEIHRRGARGEAAAGMRARCVWRQDQGLAGLREEVREIWQVDGCREIQGVGADLRRGRLGRERGETRRAGAGG